MKKKLLSRCFGIIPLAVLLLPLAITFGQTGNTLMWDYDISAGFGVGYIVDPLCTPTLPDVCVTGFDLYYTVGTATPIAAARAPVSACVLAGRKARATLQHHQPQ